MSDIGGNITSDQSVLIKNAEVAGQLVDVRCGQIIEAVAPGLSASGNEFTVDAQGAALLPGLHDHHIHLRAAAVAQRSIDCSGFAPGQVGRLRSALEQAAGTGWIRVVGYHESVAGDLDSAAVDALCADRPVRIQHASGKLWVLNSLAMQQLGAAALRNQPGVERDQQGRPCGRLWRMDGWLRQHLPASAEVGLQALSRQLAGFGVTGVTDASYTNSQSSAAAFAAAQQRGELLQHVQLMGDDSLRAGALKIMLDEDELPSLETLANRIGGAHQRGREVAFHCVSHVELLFALSALELAGVRSGVRIEHGGVIRPSVVPQLLACGATVVTQPGFVVQRGERFRQQADAADVDALYPYGSLLAAGVPAAASSDAPYGPINPWQIMAAAVERRTEAGHTLGRRECVPAAEALRGYLAAPDCPGGAARQVVPGARADLCLLDRPLSKVYSDIGAVQVLATFISGRPVYDNSANTSAVCSPR